MLIGKQLNRLGLLSILALALMASLTSFTKSDKIKFKGKKQGTVKSQKTHIAPAKDSRLWIIQYWNGTSWQNFPIADCEGNGAICSGSYVASGSPRLTPDILNEAMSQYLLTGYLSTPSINSANILVGKSYSGDPVKITVTITERSAE